MVDRIVRVVLRGEIAGFSQAMAEAKASVVSTTAAMTAANKEGEKFRTGLTTLGNQAGKVGLVAAVGLGVAIKAATDFNSELALVQTLSHASAGEMDKLSNAALTIGKNIGYSAKQVAQGEEELIKAGVSIQDILGGGLKGALDLAAAGQTDVATATSIAAAALTEFGLKGADVPHVADLLAAGADKALGSVEDLGYGLTQAGTTAAQMGFSIEQTVGTLAAFAQAGLTGERGGTTFKQMLLQLAAPASNAADLMKKLGISLYDTSGRIKTMPQLAENLSKSLSKLTPEARNSALGIIFGSRAIQGANILLANGQKGIQGWIDKTNDQGFAAQQASGKLNSLGGDVKKLGAELNAAFIGTGDGSQGALRGLTQDATKAVAAFNKLPGPIKGVTGDLLAITAVTGGALWFGSKVIGSIANTRKALTELGISSEVTRTQLRNVGSGLALGAAIIAVKELTDALGHNFDNNDLSRNLENLATDGEGYSKHFKGLASDIATVNSKLKNSGEFLDETASLFGKLGDTNLDKAQKNIKAIDEGLAQMVEGGHADEAAAALNKIIKAAQANGTSAADTVKNFKAYQTAIENLDAATTSARTPQNLLSGDYLLGAFKQGVATTAAKKHTEALKQNMKALHDDRKAARETAESFVGLGQNVDNAKFSLDHWIRDLNNEAKALEEFTANAIKAGKNGLEKGLIAELEKAGPKGALRLKQLANASDSEISKANAAYARGRRAVREYTDTVGGVKAVKVKVTGVPAAVSAIDTLLGRLGLLHTHANTNLYVNYANAAGKQSGGGRDGDPSTPYWGGGYTGDIDPRRQAGVVHGREMVFENAATSGHVAQLDALRRSLASGKSFSTAVASVVPTGNAGGGSGIDMGELVRTVAAETRPIFAPGTVFQPHNFDDITRQAAAARRMASVGGSPRRRL